MNDLSIRATDRSAASAARIDASASATHGKDIRALTGLRGVAALWVVVHHMLLGTQLPGALHHLTIHGYLAVDVFFILSGYVMSLTYERLFRTRLLGKGYAVFLIRRIARIYPLYVVSVLIVVAFNLVGLSHSWAGGFANFLLNLFMLQGWGLGDTINTPTWSISTEFGAYLLFPVFTIIMLRQPWLRIAAATLCLASIAWMSFLPLGQADRNGPLDICSTTTIFPLLRCLCEFGIGIAVYAAAKNPRVVTACGSAALSTSVILALVVSLMFAGTDLVVVLATPVIIVICATSRASFVSRFMASAPVFFLGEISYSVYLLHSQFLRIYRLGTPLLERHHVPHAVAVLITSFLLYGSLIGASYIAYRFLEVPARKAIRGLEYRLQPRAKRWV